MYRHNSFCPNRWLSCWLEALDRPTLSTMKRKSDDSLLSSPATAKKAKLILKDHFASLSYLKFLTAEIESSPSLALVIPPLIYGHSQFGEILFELKHGKEVKLAVLKLLKACFLSGESGVDAQMHEAHIPLLLGAYGAKLSESDQVICELLRIYEKRGGVDLGKYYPLIWGEVGLQRYATLKSMGPALWNRPTPDEVLECLDPKTMKWSGTKIPLEMTVDSCIDDPSLENCYDPRFLLPLFTILLAPDSVIDARQFAIAKSCLGYSISCLSLHDPVLRGIAYTVLYRLREHLRSPASTKQNFREKPQIVYIITLLRQSITKPLARLPSLSTTFLSRAVQLTAMPWDSLYSTMHAYLLLKPRFDFGDVPEFYKLFQSSEPSDRFWILKLMTDGMREATDYRICERRDAFRLIFAFYDWASSNSETEAASRQQILKIIQAVCRIASVAPDFCYRYNLIVWLSGAVWTITNEEEAEAMAIIFQLVHDNVLKKEDMPEYVTATWYAVVCTFRSKVTEWKNVDGKKEFQKKDTWKQLMVCVQSTEARLNVE